jgi:hypothetical protein
MWFKSFPNFWKFPSIPICIRLIGLLPKYTSSYIWCILDRWRTANLYIINKVHSLKVRYNTGKRRYGTHILYEKSNDLWVSTGEQYAWFAWL